MISKKLCAAFLFLASAVGGQTIDVKGSAGWTGFLDESSENHSLVAGSARIYVTRRFSVEPELQYLRRDSNHHDWVFLPSVNWDFRTGRVVPYVTGGIGLQRSTNQNAFSRFDQTEGFVSIGFGAKVYVSNQWFVAPEVRVGWEPHLRVSAGIGYTFRKP